MCRGTLLNNTTKINKYYSPAIINTSYNTSLAELGSFIFALVLTFIIEISTSENKLEKYEEKTCKMIKQFK